MNPLKTWLGYPYPLGATWMGNGVNFALFSAHATGVELCLFDSPDATHESVRIPIREQTNQIWHIFLPDFQPGDTLRVDAAGNLRIAIGASSTMALVRPGMAQAEARAAIAGSAPIQRTARQEAWLRQDRMISTEYEGMR